MPRFPKLVFIIISVQILVLASTAFIAWPEMTLWPYLVNHGWLPYQNIAIAHTPLLVFLLSVWYSLAGSSILQMKIFTWTIVATTSFLVYKKAGGDKKQTIAAATTLIFIALNFIYEGNSLWFDLMLAPMALGVYMLLEKKHYFSSGTLYALMIITKQTAFWFLLVFALNLFKNKDLIAIKKSAIGFVGVILGFFLILSVFGIVDDFYRWAIEFGVFTLPRSQGQISYPAIRQIVFALLPFSILFFTREKTLVLLSIAGALGALPRFELFHFQPALPFIALSFAEVFEHKKTKTISIAYSILIFCMFAIVLSRGLAPTVRFSDQSTNNLGRLIDSKTEDHSAIYILNDWDNLYAFSNTLPAIDPWIPHLQWYMTDEIQKEIVNDLEITKPQYIVMRSFEESGLGAFRPQIIMNYINGNYKENGTIEGRIILIRK